jgi:hypothetical protein
MQPMIWTSTHLLSDDTPSVTLSACSAPLRETLKRLFYSGFAKSTPVAIHSYTCEAGITST